MAAGLSATVLVAGVGMFLVGMRSWIKGEANMVASSNSQKALRMVSNSLREAMDVTVTGGGNKVTFVLPKKAGDGSFINPMVSDGVTRTIERTGGQIVMTTGGTSRIVARSILSREPTASVDYPLFTAPVGSVSRSLTIKIVAGSTGVRAETIIDRARETVYLRNVPQLSR